MNMISTKTTQNHLSSTIRKKQLKATMISTKNNHKFYKISISEPLQVIAGLFIQQSVWYILNYLKPSDYPIDFPHNKTSKNKYHAYYLDLCDIG